MTNDGEGLSSSRRNGPQLPFLSDKATNGARLLQSRLIQGCPVAPAAVLSTCLSHPAFVSWVGKTQLSGCFRFLQPEPRKPLRLTGVAENSSTSQHFS